MADPALENLRAAVIAEIRTAFEAVRLGDGVTLHQARALDDYAGAEAAAAARANDTETFWWDVPDEKLRYFDDVLNFLDEKGWVFYIPAFLTWVLRHLDDEDDRHSGLKSMTIYSITMQPEHSRLLDAAQARSVCRFLQFLAQHEEGWREEALEALEQCWGRFCTSRRGE